MNLHQRDRTRPDVYVNGQVMDPEGCAIRACFDPGEFCDRPMIPPLSSSSGSLRVYIASSWRNPFQPTVVATLQAAGHEVYDFREPTPGNHGFSWHEIDPTIPRGPADLELPAERIVAMLHHSAAQDGFRLDMGALEWCDACVLVLPCGRSAHLEAGWAAGAGKLTVGLLSDGEPDLMWKMLDYLCSELHEVVTILAYEATREAA